MPPEVFAVGISWRTAPVAIRERLAIDEHELTNVLAALRRHPAVAEAMLVSTCNRVEIYGAAADGAGDEAVAAVRRLLPESRGIAPAEVAPVLFGHARADAVRHVFRVAAALDSLVVGDAQILGQLKSAYQVASHAGATGPILRRCLERAFGVAKRVRSETTIARGAANVSSVAVELAERVFGDLQGKHVLVVGAGKMSTLAARHLRRAGVETLVITNRSPERAAALARELDAVARPWADLEQLLATADVVISSTGSREPILTVPLFKRVTKARRWRPVMIIDIAVPRDADPAIGKLDGVYAFDIDDLEKVVSANLGQRKQAAAEAERIVEGEIGPFEAWVASQQVVPTILALRRHFAGVAAAETEKLVALLGKKDLPAAERDHAVRRAMELVIARLLHHPQMALKSAEAQELARAAHRLFPLEIVAEDAPAKLDEAEVEAAGGRAAATTPSPAPAAAPAPASAPAAPGGV
ncbi:MAG TPA: glutamyl-tRNA reductase, partial [Kofleriaceae bacterium]|nr:glutamyl-tRNA reductase [Kofleriaceae bacterium]